MRNFQSEAPLEPLILEALNAAYQDGWADRRKVSQSSAKARALFFQTREAIAYHLGLRADSLEFIGEPRVGFHLLYNGFLHDGKSLGFSAIDKKAVIAISRGVRSTEISVDHKGQLLDIPAVDYLSFQCANSETGAIQSPVSTTAGLICDATTSAPFIPTPECAGALFDSKSWGGPAGIGVIAINERALWKNPLPHVEPVAAPHSYSLPLLIASGVALEQWVKNRSGYNKLRELTAYLRASISGAVIPGDLESSLPHITSLIFEGCISESLQRRIVERGYMVDSGSSCVSDDVKPSHVLANMGYPTQGHIQVTIHLGTTRDDIDGLVKAIKESVDEELS